MKKTKTFLCVVLAIALLIHFASASPEPGISVSIDAIDNMTGGDDLYAAYKVKIKSITMVDEKANITIRPATSGELLPGEQPADISWFEWTYKEFELPAGATKEYPLNVTLPAGVQMGRYRFVAEGRAIIPSMPWLPAESSDADEIIVTTEETIPEFTTIAIPAAAIFVLLFFIRRRRA